MSETMSFESERFEAAERRSTNVELFLDLVFVFAVTQIASMIAHAPTLAGFGKGALVAWLVWWLWSQFAWAGSAVDLETNRRAQACVVFAVPGALVMAVAIPQAFGSGAAQFGVAYLVTQAIALALIGLEMWGDPDLRATFIAYVGLAAIGPCAVALGGFVPGNARVALWGLGAFLGFAGAISTGRKRPGDGGWLIQPAHFSERHALFVIISLGEVLVAAGTTASDAGSANHLIFGLVSPVLVACVLWWLYFAFVPRVTEDALRRIPPKERGVVARNMFSFTHFPIIFGIILYAVVAKHVVLHPDHHMSTFDQRIFILSVLAILGGFMAIHFQYNRGFAWERVAAFGVLVAVIRGLGAVLPSSVVVLIAAAVLTAMHAFTITSYERRIRASTESV